MDDVADTCPGFQSIETFDGQSYGPVTILSYQRYKFRLYYIASSIARNIYLRSNTTLKDMVSEIKAFNQRLVEWEKCIPPELQLKCLKIVPTSNKDRIIFDQFRLQALVLQLSYDNIQLVLHRPLLTMNRISRGPSYAADVTHAVESDPLTISKDELNGMIKASKYRCWVSSLRTSGIGDYADILVLSRNTHGAAYAGIQAFTSGVVLGIFALSDPLSDQAHQAKKAVSKIIRLPALHKYRTNVSDQCGKILEELLRLVMAEEMQALLAANDHDDQGAVYGVASNNPHPANDLGSTLAEARDDRSGLEMPVPEFSADPSLSLDMNTFPQSPELPLDGNFSDALLSLQDGMSTWNLQVEIFANMFSFPRWSSSRAKHAQPRNVNGFTCEQW